MEFLRRFLRHVLSTGFIKIRYYGFLNPNSEERASAGASCLPSIRSNPFFIIFAVILSFFYKNPGDSLYL